MEEVVMVDMVDMVEELEAFSQELDRRLLKEVQEDLCYHMQDLLFLRWAFQEGVLVVVSERKLPKCQVSECRDFTKVDWYLDKDLADVEFCLLEGQDKQVKDRIIKSVHMYSVTGGRGYGGPMQQGLFHGYPLKSPKVQGGYGTKSGGKQPLGYGFGNGGAGLPGGQGGPVLRPGYPVGTGVGPGGISLAQAKAAKYGVGNVGNVGGAGGLYPGQVLAVLVFSIQGRCQEVLAVLVVCIHGRCQEVLAMLAVLVVCIQGRCQEVEYHGVGNVGAAGVQYPWQVPGGVGTGGISPAQAKAAKYGSYVLAMLAVLAVLVFSIHGRCQEVLAMLAVLGVLVFHIQGRCQEELEPVASQLLRLKLPNMELGPVASHLLRLKLPNMVWVQLVVLLALVDCIQGNGQEALVDCIQGNCQEALVDCIQGKCQEALVDCIQGKCQEALVDCIRGNCQEALVDCIQGNCQEVWVWQGVLVVEEPVALEDSIQGNCQEALEDIIQGNCQEALEDSIQGNCQEALEDSIQGNCQEALVDSFQGRCQEVKAVQGVFQVVVQVEEEFLDESHFYQDMDGMDLGLESNPQSMELREALEQGLFQDGEEQEQFLEFKEELEWGSYQEQEEYQQVLDTYKVDNTLLPQKLLNTEASLGLALGGDQLLQLQRAALAQMVMLLGYQFLVVFFSPVVEQVLQYPLVLVQLAKASLVSVLAQVAKHLNRTYRLLAEQEEQGSHWQQEAIKVGCSIPLQVDWEVLEVELNHPNQATVILEVAVFISQVQFLWLLWSLVMEEATPNSTTKPKQRSTAHCRASLVQEEGELEEEEEESTEVALRDARANSVGGGSRAHQCDLDKPRCYCMI
ncbi:hypothetical protein F7725_020795 [Dissostichus mawsoni]|uniref:Elastin n=1 Tax=Dissostichus mawsoni TaxID=36200 RepID=A0A7J5YGY9_DISMA|nr:hypothetical protein F7725_020795 [Dissostichus mawsoni]